jgi:hypothetical protein
LRNSEAAQEADEALEVDLEEDHQEVDMEEDHQVVDMEEANQDQVNSDLATITQIQAQVDSVQEAEDKDEENKNGTNKHLEKDQEVLITEGLLEEEQRVKQIEPVDQQDQETDLQELWVDTTITEVSNQEVVVQDDLPEVDNHKKVE